MEFSRPVDVPLIPNYADFLQEKNMKENWLDLYILDTYQDRTFIGTKILSHQTRRLQEVDSAEEPTEFGQNKNFDWTISEFKP